MVSLTGFKLQTIEYFGFFVTFVDFSDRLAANGQRALLDVGVKLACVSAASIVFFFGFHGAKIVVFLENLEAMLGEYGLISNFEGSGSLGKNLW